MVVQLRWANRLSIERMLEDGHASLWLWKCLGDGAEKLYYDSPIFHMYFIVLKAKTKVLAAAMAFGPQWQEIGLPTQFPQHVSGVGGVMQCCKCNIKIDRHSSVHLI